MRIGVGRLPVRTLEQATQVVDKLCTYMDNQSLGKWKSQICFLADDGDAGIHIETADGAAEILRKENPNFVEENKADLCASLQKTIIDILIDNQHTTLVDILYPVVILLVKTA